MREKWRVMEVERATFGNRVDIERREPEIWTTLSGMIALAQWVGESRSKWTGRAKG